MDGKTKARLGGGIALDVAGIALIAFGVPEGDWKVAAGLALMLAGGWLVSSSLRAGSPGAAPDASEVEASRSRWRPEPELRHEPPRAVRMRPTSKIVAAVWLLVLAVAGAYAYLTVFTRNAPPPSRNLLDVEGAHTEATVHRREVRENASGQPRYVLYYNFKDAAGSAVRSSVNVPKVLFDRYEEGAQLETVYLPEDPVMHYVPALTRPAFAEKGLLMALVTAACLGFLLENRRRRHRRLAREGTPVAAVAENVRRRGGARAYDVKFKVKGRDGSLRTLERNRLRRNGDVLTVLYDSKGAGDALLYHQCMYQAVE